jgi:hypothetical protein
MSIVTLNVNVQFVKHGTLQVQDVLVFGADQRRRGSSRSVKRPQSFILPPLTIGDAVVPSAPVHILEHYDASDVTSRQ